MPRSSRHKSSKHSSRDARDSLDSDKDSVVNDHKAKEDKESTARVSKDSGTGEKRKLEYKDSYVSGNGEYVEDYSSSRRRKERFEGGVSDRWNGSEDDRREGTKKSKERPSGSKSRKSVGMHVEIDDAVKQSSAKSDRKHRELSSWKEGKEGGAERERERDRGRDREGEKEKERERERKGKDKDKDGKSKRVEHTQVAKPWTREPVREMDEEKEGWFWGWGQASG